MEIVRTSIVIIFFFYIFFSCKEQVNYDTEIKEQIENMDNSEPKLLDLSSIFPFEWDSLYVIPSATSSDVIEKTIGITIHKKGRYNMDDRYERLVFKNQGVIVYQDSIKYRDPSSFWGSNRSIQFMEGNIEVYQFYRLYTNKLFEVKKDDALYYLYPYENYQPNYN